MIAATGNWLPILPAEAARLFSVMIVPWWIAGHALLRSSLKVSSKVEDRRAGRDASTAGALLFVNRADTCASLRVLVLLDAEVDCVGPFRGTVLTAASG